jgi:hypothetical protein
MENLSILQLLTILAQIKKEYDSGYGSQCSMVMYDNGTGRVDMPYTSLSGEREICIFAFDNETQLREFAITEIGETFIKIKTDEIFIKTATK